MLPAREGPVSSAFWTDKREKEKEREEKKQIGESQSCTGHWNRLKKTEKTLALSSFTTLLSSPLAFPLPLSGPPPAPERREGQP